MSKFLPVVLMLILMSISSAIFLRPWDNQTWVATNPHIDFFGIRYWWNLPALHGTLDSMDTGRAKTLPLPAAIKEDVENTAEASAKAYYQKENCIAYMTATLGMFPQSPFGPFIAAFSEEVGCVSYKNSWQAAVSSSLSSAEKALSESKRSIGEARDAYEEIVFMGLCEGHYSEAGSDSCPELRSAFAAVDNNLTEGRYGTYAMLLAHEEELKQRLRDPAPDLSIWPSMLELAFGDAGVVAVFEGVKKEALLVKESSEGAFSRLSDSASIRKAESERRIKDLDSQKLYLIDEAPSGYEAGEVGSIQERFAEILDEKDRADLVLAEAKATRDRVKERGYMATAIGLMYRADKTYLQVLEAADSLEKDTIDTVRQKKEEAQKEISDTKKSFSSSPGSTEALDMLEDAEDYLRKGDAATLSGACFAYYSQAAALARAARDAGKMEAEADASATMALLDELISKAERDGLDVAGEEELLRLASSLSSAQAEEAAQQAIDAIILKARARYEADILDSRDRIYDKLVLAGPDAADLYTDMGNLEAGLITDDAILFRQAIGSLSNLAKGYSIVEDELDKYMADIVGNAMSADVPPLVSPVKLDEPSDIVVDAVLTNPRPYGATTVSATIHGNPSFGFLYSDMTYGKEDVVSIREGGGGIIVVFSEVQPFETKRVVFEKQAVMARTLERTVVADGLGDGRALVREKIEFELDSDVPSVELPSGCGEALIDGLSPSRPLEKGKHTLSCEQIVDDAYDEEVANFRSFPISSTSRVEFDIRIHPHMDLDSVPVFIEGIDGSAISKFKLSPVTGCRIKEQSSISDTQYSALLAGLEEENTAVLRVSYTIDDTQSFVQSQLSALQAANLSAEATALVDQAVLQAEAANYSKALELISQAVARSKADEKADAKLIKKKEELIAEIRGELAEIESALSVSLSDSGIAARLSARKEELLLVIEDAENQSLEDAAEVLGRLDMKWLGKEITSFKKDAYKSYNDLKERFYLAGNASTPDEFLRFEDALQKLGAGGRLEYAVQAADALGTIEGIVETQEQSQSSMESQMKSLLESLESETLAVFDIYSHEASAAKGTDYSSFFTISQSKIDRIVKDAETAMKKDVQLALPKIDELNQTKDKMLLTLESLKEESDAKISILSAMIEEKDMEDDKRSESRRKLDDIRDMAATGEYVNSLRAGSSLAKEIETDSAPSSDGLMVLGFTAMAMMAAAGFYLFKQQKPKHLRKLPSLNDEKAKTSEKELEKEKITSSPLSPPLSRPSQSQTPRKQVSGSLSGQR